MTSQGWLILIAAALLLGGAIGAGAAWRLAQRRFAGQLQRATEELQQKHAAVAEQLRTVQARSLAELEQTRSNFKRQLAAASEEPRNAAARAEERLRAAYDELDRLRRAATAVDSSAADLTDGFAATRPMHDGL